MTVEYRTHEFCRTCREINAFDTLPSGGGSAPAFRICAQCGSGYSIDREATA